MWFGKSEIELEQAHRERMKSLEMGFPLPDAELAWVEVVQLRGSQVTAVLIVGTLGLVGAPVGTTAVVLALLQNRDLPVWLIPIVLFFLWSVCGYLLYTLISSGMKTLSEIKRPADFVAKPTRQLAANGVKGAKEVSEVRVPSERIQQG